MAYWFVPFKSLNGDDYTLRIAGATSATPITLTGAAQPIVTQEDDDRDMFKPVRLQSGYIRIADTGQTATGASFDWHDLMPSSAVDRPVQLLKYTSGGYNIVWQGFIRPETYSGNYKEMPQEREFPVYCPLSVLEAFDASIPDTGVHNFAWLILHILQTYYTIEIDTFYFSRPQDIESWLKVCFQRDNLINDDGTAKYNALELLEEVCTFWGWTCRIDGTSIYFVQPDDTTAPNLAQLSLVDMQDIADQVGIDVTSVGWTSRTVAGQTVYAGSGEEYIQGIKNVKLDADINKRDDVLVVPMDKWADDYRTNSIVHASSGDKHMFLLFDSSDHWDGNFFTKEEDDMWITCQRDSDPATQFGALQVVEYFDGDVSTKHNYNFAGRFHTSWSPFTDPTATNWNIRIVSKRSYNLAQGALVINAKRVSPDFDPVQYAGYFKMAVKWGNNYYHQGSHGPATATWQSTFDYFGPTWTTSGTPDTRYLEEDTMPYTGIGCYVNQPQGGIIEILLYGGQVNYFDISSLEISFVRNKIDALPNTKSQNTYEVKGNADFQNDVSLGTIFASDNNNERGLGIITDRQGRYLSTVDYTVGSTTTGKHPEQHLVDRIAAYGSTTKKVLTLNVRNGSTVYTPGTKVTDEDGTTYTPVAISHDWAEDETNYILLQL